ncbi:unknown [Tannerella sp. CAG:118]|nr:unknown [Tannerella sp. CAG:118]
MGRKNPECRFMIYNGQNWVVKYFPGGYSYILFGNNINDLL